VLAKFEIKKRKDRVKKRGYREASNLGGDGGAYGIRSKGGGGSEYNLR